MTKKEMIAKIQKAEREAWVNYNEAKAQAEDGRFGAIAKEVEKTSRTRWAAMYQLMEELKIA